MHVVGKLPVEQQNDGILVAMLLKDLTLGYCFHQLFKVFPISRFEQSIPCIRDVIVIDV